VSKLFFADLGSVPPTGKLKIENRKGKLQTSNFKLQTRIHTERVSSRNAKLEMRNKKTTNDKKMAGMRGGTGSISSTIFACEFGYAVPSSR
jgi:hypothetical protein